MFPEVSGESFLIAHATAYNGAPSFPDMYMSLPFFPFPNERPICPVDALPDPLRDAVLYAIVKEEVPPAIALMDVIAAVGAVVHCGYDCVTPGGGSMAASLYTLTSAPSITGKGVSYRIFFRHFTQARKGAMAALIKAGPEPSMPKTRATAIVEDLVSDMTYFALLHSLHGQGKNVAIQDEDAATFFESELFKSHLSRLTQAWSGDPPLSRAFGSRQFYASDARCSIGLRTQPDILDEVPASRLRMAIKVGFFPRFIVGCHDPYRFPLNETYHVYQGREPSDRAYQARMTSLAFIINMRNFTGFAGRVRVELDTDAKAFMHELRWRMKGWKDTCYADIREAAGRAWENTLRLAVDLHVFCSDASKVSRDYVECAWAIVEWSLSQHRLIFIESPRMPEIAAITAPMTRARPIRATQPKAQKLPRPLQDAKWFVLCLAKLLAPGKSVTVREVNQLAGLSDKRLQVVLAWIELEGMVRLGPMGSDTVITPLINSHPLWHIGH